MWPSTESRPRPIVTTETWVPPASRQASISVATSPTSPRRKRHIVRAEVFDRPAETAHAITQPFPGVEVVIDAAAEEDEAVREPGGPVERHLARSTKPDRDGPRWLRHESGSVNPVEPAREVDDRFSEQPAKQLDLLLLPGAAGTEVLPEGLVLDVVPADPYTEAQPTAGQEINIGCLPCHERCLALRKYKDPGGETDSLGDAGQIGKHHERLVERVPLGVGTRQLRCPIGVNGTEHMVVREEVVKAQVLDCSANPPNSGRIASKLDLRVDDTDLHGVQPVTGSTQLDAIDEEIIVAVSYERPVSFGAGLLGRITLDAKWYIGDELVAHGRKPADYDPAAFQGVERSRTCDTGSCA